VIRLFEAAEKKSLCGQEALFTVPKKQARQKDAPLGPKKSRIEELKSGHAAPTVSSTPSLIRSMKGRKRPCCTRVGIFSLLRGLERADHDSDAPDGLSD